MNTINTNLWMPADKLLLILQRENMHLAALKAIRLLMIMEVPMPTIKRFALRMKTKMLIAEDRKTDGRK